RPCLKIVVDPHARPEPNLGHAEAPREHWPAGESDRDGKPNRAEERALSGHIGACDDEERARAREREIVRDPLRWLDERMRQTDGFKRLSGSDKLWIYALGFNRAEGRERDKGLELAERTERLLEALPMLFAICDEAPR